MAMTMKIRAKGINYSCITETNSSQPIFPAGSLGSRGAKDWTTIGRRRRYSPTERHRVSSLLTNCRRVKC